MIVCSGRPVRRAWWRPQHAPGLLVCIRPRQANSALWRIVFTRMTTDPRTMAYVARRTTEGKSIRELMRCLKRYVAREVCKALTAPPARPSPSYAQRIS